MARWGWDPAKAGGGLGALRVVSVCVHLVFPAEYFFKRIQLITWLLNGQSHHLFKHFLNACVKVFAAIHQPFKKIKTLILRTPRRHHSFTLQSAWPLRQPAHGPAASSCRPTAGFAAQPFSVPGTDSLPLAWVPASVVLTLPGWGSYFICHSCRDWNPSYSWTPAQWLGLCRLLPEFSIYLPSGGLPAAGRSSVWPTCLPVSGAGSSECSTLTTPQNPRGPAYLKPSESYFGRGRPGTHIYHASQVTPRCSQGRKPLSSTISPVPAPDVPSPGRRDHPTEPGLRRKLPVGQVSGPSDSHLAARHGGAHDFLGLN